MVHNQPQLFTALWFPNNSTPRDAVHIMFGSEIWTKSLGKPNSLLKLRFINFFYAKEHMSITKPSFEELKNQCLLNFLTSNKTLRGAVHIMLR